MSSVDAAVQGDPHNQFIRGVGAQASGMLALILEREGNTKGAIELTELSLQYSPGVSRTLSQLSRLYARAGDHERAIATSLQALRARSTAADSGSDYVNVGAQLYRAKRLDEARQAFAEAYAKLDTIAGAERDYALLYWLALARRAGASAEAERSLRQRLDRKDTGWTTDLLAFSADRLSAEALLDRARRAWQRCEAFYVIGARVLAQGRPADARRYFASAVATQVTSYLEYDFARIELQLLDEQPARASPGSVGRR
jgi:lipoprotein NlpI